MATTFASTIEQLKFDFYATHAHLPEHERHQLWLRTISSPPGQTQQHIPDNVPRSMACTQQPQLSDFATSHFGTMERIPSHPGSSPMERQLSNWQNDHQPAYTILPESASIFSSIGQSSAFTNNTMVENSPSDYINSFMNPSTSSLPLSFPPQPPQLHFPLTHDAQWSPQLDPSTSPSTPSTTLMTPVIHSNNMSRQSSHNPHFFDDSSSMQFSDSSASVFPIPDGDGAISFPLHDKSINHGVDTLNFLDQFTGLSSEAFSSSVPVFPSSTASASALASSQNEQDLAEDMTRSASSSGESHVSAHSQPSTGLRHVRRGREINAQAGRCRIAPKASPNKAKIESAPSNAKMVRIQSADGSSKDVGVISKAAYVRPQHPKIMCTQCNERPDGFRGTHELERHVARAHTAIRKGFICVDASPNQRFLANCKHCRNKKVYGAYYNAAAHLRRTHFHPRDRAKKGKRDERRGGIGGGDDPPMDFLKQHWIREVEVENKPATAQSPDSSSSDNSMEPTDMSGYDASSFNFNSPIATNVDASQYFGYSDSSNVNNSMGLAEPDGSSFMYTTHDPLASDINNFQFDAHRLQ